MTAVCDRERKSAAQPGLRAFASWLPWLRHSHHDALLVSLALLHGVVLWNWPSIPVIAVGLWWNSNTIAHYFIHLPFFTSRAWNRCFSAYQTLLLGVPQRLWRDRHLAHHGEVQWRLRFSPQLLFETGLVLALWSVLFAMAPVFFATVYLPGWALGLGLCYLQGHYEHARGTTSHYSRIYNTLFFNDGFHVEHHAHPGAHWTVLPRQKADGPISRWPAALRWLDAINLEALERLVLRSSFLQQFVVRRHRAAFEALLADEPSRQWRSLAVVGGGMFPRTALVLRELLPNCAITIIEEKPEHIALAQHWIDPGIECITARYDAFFSRSFDAVVIPLAFRGDVEGLCAGRKSATLFVHDWLWRRRGKSRVVSWLLCKRLNRIDP